MTLRSQAIEEARLYLVAPGDFDPVTEVIEAGVDVVQLRMKEAEALQVIEAGERFAKACSNTGVSFIVNDRPDIAMALGADGVHLGQDDLPPAVARDLLGPEAIIGRSTHSVADIDRARTEYGEGFCDYIAVGPVHATPTKPGRPSVGYELVRHAAEHVDLPWFAIGGIDASNVAEVLEAGARRIVVVRAITEAADPVDAVARLKRALA